MKHFAISWANLVANLDAWEKVSLESRRLFLSMKSEIRPQAGEFGPDLNLLVDQKLLTLYTDGERVRLHDDARQFNRAMRAISRNPLFAAQTEACLRAYLHDNFDPDEIAGLASRFGNYYNSESSLMHQATSEQWLLDFLAGDPADWEQSRRRHDEPSSLAGQEFIEGTKSLIGEAAKQSEPIPLRDLPSLVPDLPEKRFDSAVRFGLRYLLLFPDMRSDLTPVIGLWPGVAARLHRPKAAAPSEVRPRETFQLAYRLEDLTTLLVAVSGDGLRVRASDYALFERARAQIIANLPALPEWIRRFDYAALSQRIEIAQRLLGEMKLIDHRGRSGSDRRIEAASTAEPWLAKSAAQRLQTILDHLSPLAKASARYSYAGQLNGDLNLPEAIVAAYRGVADRRHVALEEFLCWHSQSANPFIEKASREGASSVRLDWSHAPATGQQMEDEWRKLLRVHLSECLLPLGGVEVGICDDDSLCFKLTDVGRFMLGLTPQLQYRPEAGHGGAVVVQPNFDVVFLQSSPLAEATIARFAERQRSGLGALFKITKSSILNAAGSGITSEQVVETLRGACSKELPANVECEITGWFAGCRRINMKSTILMHCPDPQTAARIVAASGRKASLLNDTVVELQDAKFKTSLLKKLKAEGIFATSPSRRD